MAQDQELRTHIKTLGEGTAVVRSLQKLIMMCNANPAAGEDLPPQTPNTPTRVGGHHVMLESDIWQGGRMFDALFDALDQFIRNKTVRLVFSLVHKAYHTEYLHQDAELIEYGLCVLWEMVENQTTYLDEAKVFSLLFRVRYSNTHPVCISCLASYGIQSTCSFRF